MTTALLLMGLAMTDGGGLVSPPTPPAEMDQEATFGANVYFHVSARDGLVFVVSLWEKFPDADGEIGKPECILDCRTRIGLGRGVWIRGSGSFADPIFLAAPNRGIGSLACLRISPKFSESSLFTEPEPDQ